MMRIAVDGPSGAGKSTVARRIADRLGIDYIDTGAMYRAVGYKLLKEGVSLENTEAVQELLDRTEIDFSNGKIFLDGEDVSGLIRTQEIAGQASACSAIGIVRTKLVDLQRKMGREKSVIMDGRDIGTNVLPDASLKIYLTASADVRAKRRYDELQEKGTECDIAQIKSDIMARDKQDMEREIAPLCKAEDAILVDSSDMSIPQVIDTIISEFKKIK